MSRQTAIQKTTRNEIEVNTPQAQPAPQPSHTWSYLPAIDVLEWKHEYTIVCDAPGLVAEQINLTYENGVLNLHAPVQPRTSPQVNYLRQEYGVGDFDRAIPLGRLAEFVDGDRMSAIYETGVLTVHLPKLEGAHGKRIHVKAG